MREWESQFRIVHLLDVRATTFTCWNNYNFQDLDGAGTSTMTCSHIAVTLSDGTSHCDVAVLTVHVVCPTSGVITNPNSKILHRSLIFLKHLLTRHNFSHRFLQFLQFLHVVPETRFGSNNIRSKNPHAKYRGFGVLLSWHTSTNDLKFFQLAKTLHLHCLNYSLMTLISVTICSLIFFICPM